MTCKKDNKDSIRDSIINTKTTAKSLYRDPAKDSQFYGLESHFNQDAIFYNDVIVYGNLLFDATTQSRSFLVNDLSVLGFSTFFGSVDFYDDVYIDSNLNAGIITARNQLNVGCGGTVLTASADIQKVGIGITDPRETLDIIGSLIVSEKVGIGTTNPIANLDVIGNARITQKIGIGTTNPIANLDVIGNARITQKIGIGTTNPIANLDVIGNARITGDTTITGILTVGSSSVTIDGDNNLVKANSIQTTSNKPILNSSGSVINVYTKIDTTQAFYNTTADVDLTGLSITLTPTSINSKFILHANIVTTRNFIIAFGFKRGTTKIGKSATNINAGLGTGFTHIYHSGSTNGDQESKFILDDDTPSTTSPVTYTPFVKNSWNNSSQSWYYNNRNNDDMGSTSVFTIYEVVG